MSKKQPDSDIYLRIIAIFKLTKAALFFVAAAGILHLLHKDVSAMLEKAIDNLHVDPDNRGAQWCLDKAGSLTKTKIASIGAIAFCYGCLFTTEGLGLYFRKRWAEWLVVIITGSLLPVEIYELCVAVSWIKVLVLVSNLAIIGYLIYVIRQKEK